MANISKQPINLLSNETQDYTPTCKVVVYNWASRFLSLSGSSDNTLSKSSPLDVSSQILGASFTKIDGQPSGTFSFTLSNSPNYGSGDWSDIIKRGEWCLIYMSQDRDLTLSEVVGPPNPSSQKKQEAKKVRCIGYIDRVAPKLEIQENGSLDITYEVSGRDFGVVYENTTIWTNIFNTEKTVLDAVANSFLNVVGTVSIDEVLDKMHDLFYNPKALPGSSEFLNKNGSLTEIALQWLMPRQLLVDLGLSPDSTPYWGELPNIRNFSKTAATLGISKPTDFLTGNAWENLKKLSVPEFHELYTETTDSGLPELVFRPFPFSIDNSKYPILSKYVTLFKDLPLVDVPALDVLDSNLSEDDHERYNSFLVTVTSSYINSNSNIDVLRNTGYPKHVQDSIKRHGFRPMHVEISALVRNAEKSNGSEDLKLLVEYNELNYDYWNNAVFFSSGSAHIFGKNEIKIGKCVKFGDSTPHISGKRFYIEGYTDEFVIEENGSSVWTQTLMLTRGAEERDLREKNQFGIRNTVFPHQGEFTSSSNPTPGKVPK